MQNLACGSPLSPPCIPWWQAVVETTVPVPLGCLYSFDCRLASVESQTMSCKLPSQGCCGGCQCVLPWEDTVCNLCTIYKGSRARSSACFTVASFCPRIEIGCCFGSEEGGGVNALYSLYPPLLQLYGLLTIYTSR